MPIDTNETGKPASKPNPATNYPEENEHDHLGMYDNWKIWQHIWATINEKYGPNLPLTDTEFAELRRGVGGLLSILGEIIGLTDDNGPATLSVLLEHIDNERVRRIPAFAKFLDVIVPLQGVFDTATTELHGAFSELEDGFYELVDDLEADDEEDEEYEQGETSDAEEATNAAEETAAAPKTTIEPKLPDNDRPPPNDGRAADRRDAAVPACALCGKPATGGISRAEALRRLLNLP